ncbi:uncharacterized protein N7483_002735 [Penicillium malachiteum]|uniref:uncharacterized protein n=1 Tax=Penicillium malachiteum TaxID=1324776 RepID=UPI0025483E2A|nr:uncharacterized protein N7483_002735 [Penicillium malachiteum]KAJ5737610.1 hypothetical protein N7483_002735 [Penicillium malachiteum]
MTYADRVDVNRKLTPINQPTITISHSFIKSKMSLFASLRPTTRLATAARSFSTTSARPAARITITGRLAADPELVATSTGQDVIKYAVGTSSGPRDNKQTSWFRVASFAEGGQRDYLMSLQKGTLVHVEGDAKLKTYEDSEGRRQTTLNITQRFIEVLSRPQNNNSEHHESH